MGAGIENLGEVRGWSKVLRFTLPSIFMMLFISTYSLVDGAFVSNFINTDALASMNILMPLWSLMTGLGFMMATGGSAYVSNLLGQNKPDEAKASFSEIMLITTVITITIAALCFVFAEPLVRLMGADDTLIFYSLEYLYVFLPFTVFFILQFLCSQFLVVAGRPGMALVLSIAGGLTNMMMDYVLIVVAEWGVTGAAIASGLGAAIPSVIGILVFSLKSTNIHFTKPLRDPKVVTKTCSNGISEMVSEVSGGITIMCFNLVMMSYIGPDGVSAITIISYVQFLALSVVIGYANGIAPVMSFNHGAGDREGMSSVYRTSVIFVAAISVFVFLFMELFSRNIVGVFASDSPEVMDIAVHGASIFSFAFLLMGFNVYSSSLFTSLSNGLVSAVISSLRSFVLLAPFIIILPYLFGIDWVWLAVPLTDLVTFVVAITLVVKLNGRYGYLGKGRVSES
jgi:putative MATE family efflux protein